MNPAETHPRLPPTIPVSLLDRLREGIVITDPGSHIVWANRAYCAMTGRSLEELAGRTPALIRADRTDLGAVQAIWDSLSACGEYQGRVIDRRADGTHFHAALSVVHLDEHDLYLGTLRDVSADVELEERSARRAEQATRARDAVIRVMAGLAERRDGAESAHLARIESYAATLARWLLARCPDRLPEWAQSPEEIAQAAVLHDLGKLSIPDRILLKPGPLEPDEQEIVRSHPQLGVEILERALAQQPRSPFLRLARDVVAFHHEAWDGSGYPFGLRGEEIPLEAQIASAADVLDALTSSRAYKPAYSFDRAVAWMAERAGKQFDPLVVEALLATREALEATYRRLGEPATADRVEGTGLAPLPPAPASDPATRGALRRTGRSPMVAIMEAINSAAGGEVVVRGSEATGRVYVAGGRIAWAHLSPARGVLKDRLAAEGVAPQRLEEVVAECKRTGRNFGEALVDRGLIGHEHLKGVLRGHIAENLRAVLGLREPVALFIPQGRPYSAGLTFRLAELIGQPAA